jgi:hypothetical protein
VHLECKDGIFKGYLTLGNTTEQEVNKLCVELKKIHEVERAVTIR